MKKILFKIIPQYALLPLIICIAMNALSFYGTRLFSDGWTHYSVEISIDKIIPFIPAFIIIYVLSFVQWALGYITTAREDKEFCYRFYSAIVLAKIICTVVFLVYPTVMTRPEVVGTDFFSWATRFIYSADTPTNLFPSIHCFESTLFAVAVVSSKKLPSWYKVLNVLFTVLVYASVVFVKQHVFLDILGGIALAALCIFASKAFKLGRIFDILPCNKKEN